MYDFGMTRLCREALMLRQWRGRMKYSQAKAAEELSRLRGWTLYAHQISHWESGAGMSQATRRSIREALAAAAAEEANPEKKAG
jgi:hypothetical protein